MSLSKEDIKEINDAVRAGDAETARFILNTSDDPRAAAMLEKINARFPSGSKPRPPSSAAAAKPKPVTIRDMPPAAQDDGMSEIKIAIREKRFDDAEALLILSNHPDAETLRQRLSETRGGGGKAKNVYIQESKDFSTRLAITIILLFFFTIPGLIALGVFVPEAKKHPDAPGAGGLLLLNTIVRVILYMALALVVVMLALLFLVPPRPR